MDDALSLLLTLQIRAVGYDIIGAVADSLENLTGKAGVLGVATGAATLGLTALAGGILAVGAAVAQAGKFDEYTTEIANNANMTDAALQQMQGTVLQVAANTGQNMDQIAQGFMHVSDEGFKGAAGVDVLTTAAESAASTGANVSNVANLLATTLHQWGLGSEYAAQTMDTLHIASALSNVTLDQFTSGLRNVAPAAMAVGIPIDQTAAALAVMTQNGYTANQAGTQLRGMFTHISDPLPAAKKAIEELSRTTGVDLVHDFSQTGLATKGLTGVLSDIATATHGDVQAFAELTTGQKLSADQANLVTQASHGNLQALQAMVPATRGLFAEYVLTNNGAKDYLDILRQISAGHEGAGVTAQNFARWQATLGAQTQILAANVKVAAIELGNEFLPVFQAAVSFIIDDVIPAVEVVSQRIAGVLVPALQAAGTWFGNLINLLRSGNIVGALEQIVGAVISFGTNMFNAGVNLIQQLGAGMMEAAETVVMTVINEIASMIASFFVGMSPPPNGPLSHIVEGGRNTMGGFVQGLQEGTAGIPAVADQVGVSLATIPDKAKAVELTNQYLNAKDAVYSIKDAGAQATISLQALNAQIQTQKDLIQGQKDLEQQITDNYGSQIEQQQQVVDNLRQAVDYNQQIADAQQKVQMALLDQKILTDEGDQGKKSALEQQLESVRAHQQELSIEAQILDTQNRKKALAGDPTQLQALNLKLQELDIQKQIYDLVPDHTQLDADKTAKAALAAQMAKAAADKAVADAKAKEVLAEQEKKLADLKKAEEDKLEPIKKQIEGYTLALNMLNDQKAALSQGKADLGAQATLAGDLAGRLQTAATAAKGITGFGGGGKGFSFPKAAPPDIGSLYDPAAIAAAVKKNGDAAAAALKTSVENATADAVGKAQEGARKAVASFLDNFRFDPVALNASMRAGLATLPATITNALSNVGTTLQNQVFPAIGNAFAGLNSFILSKLSGSNNWAVIWLHDSFQSGGFAGALSAGFQILGTLLQQKIDELGPIVKEKFNEFMDNIRIFLTSKIGAINTQALFGLFGTLGDALHLLGDQLKANSPLVTLLTNAFIGLSAISLTFTSILLHIVYWFQQHTLAMNALKVVLVAVGTAFLILNAPIVLVVAAILAVAAAIGDIITHKDDLGRMFSGWGTAVRGFATDLKNYVGDAFSQFGAAVSSEISSITGIWTGFWTGLSDIQNNINSTIEGAWTGFWNEMGSIADGFIATGKKVWGDFWGAIQLAAQTYWDLVKGAFQVAITLITGLFTAFTQVLNGNWSQAWTTIQQTFSTISTEILNALPGFVSQFILQITGLITTALGKLKDSIPQWVQAGKDMVGGIVGGIMDAAKGVAIAAANAVSGAIAAARGALGNPHSPAPATVPLGESFATGFIQGLTNTTTAVAAAGANLMNQAVGSATGSRIVAPSSGGGGGGGGPTILVQGNYFLTQQMLQDFAQMIGDQFVSSTKLSYSILR